MSGALGLLRYPGVARVFCSQLVARLPLGMMGLGLTLHVQRVTGSYPATGLAMCAFSLGGAVSGPLLGRALTVLDRRTVLIASSSVCAAVLAAMALPWWGAAGLVALAAITGLCLPPVSSAARGIYPALVPAGRVPALFSLDASSQELLWMVGPPAVSALAVAVGTGSALVLAAVVMAAGGLWFVGAEPVRRAPLPAPRRARGRLPRPSRAVFSCTVVALLLNGACAAVELGVVAAVPASLTGPLLAVWSLASLLGGVAAGRWAPGRWSLARRVALTGAGIGLAACWLQPGWLAAALVVCGAGIAPAIAVLYTQVSDGEEDSAEAFGWLTSGMMVGSAGGAALAGAVTSHAGARGAFALGALAAVAAALVAARGLLRGPGADAGVTTVSGAVDPVRAASVPD